MVTGVGGRGERGINWDFGIDIYKLLYTEQIHNRALLQSTGNYSQWFVVTCNENIMERICVYICVRVYIYLNQ